MPGGEVTERVRVPGDAGPRQESLGALFGQLSDDAKSYARAEIGRVRALIFRRVVKARLAILLMVSAALLTQSAVLVLLTGLLLYLAPHVGVIWATVICMVMALIVAGIMARLAFWQVRRAVGDKEDLT